MTAPPAMVAVVSGAADETELKVEAETETAPAKKGRAVSAQPDKPKAVRAAAVKAASAKAVSVKTSSRPEKKAVRKATKTKAK